VFRYSRHRRVRCRHESAGSDGADRGQRRDPDANSTAADRDSTDTDPTAGSDALSATRLEILEDHFASDNC